MTPLVKGNKVPKRLELRGQGTLSLQITQTPAGVYTLSIVVVIPLHRGRGRLRRHVLSTEECHTEADLWRTVRDFADSKYVGIAEIETSQVVA